MRCASIYCATLRHKHRKYLNSTCLTACNIVWIVKLSRQKRKKNVCSTQMQLFRIGFCAELQFGSNANQMYHKLNVCRQNRVKGSTAFCSKFHSKWTQICFFLSIKKNVYFTWNRMHIEWRIEIKFKKNPIEYSIRNKHNCDHTFFFCRLSWF